MKNQSLIVTMILGLTLLAFQNCSKGVNFGANNGKNQDLIVAANGSDANDSIDNQNSNTLSVDEPVTTEESGNTVVVAPPVQSNQPPVVEQVVTIPVIDNAPVVYQGCLSYVEIINDGNLLNIPARTANGICYYIKIFDKISVHRSGTSGELRDLEVLASNHDGDSKTYISPFTMGDKKVRFNKSAYWKMSLSGAFNDPKVKMAIDNFFLVQFSYGLNPRIQINSAFGTADAEPKTTEKPIYLNSTPLSFKSFAPGGTAYVEALGLILPDESSNNQSNDLELRVRALDCGGSAELKDVYLVFY
jgi:hypothetical protein